MKKSLLSIVILLLLITSIGYAKELNGNSYHEGEIYGAYNENIISIVGEGIEQSKNITVDNLEKMTQVEEYLFTMQTLVEPHNGRYKGVTVWDLLNDVVELKKEARKVIFICSDGVSMEFSLNDIKKNDYVNSVDNSKLPIILAYAKDGYPLVSEQNDKGYIKGIGNDGGPIRLMVGQTIKGERNSTKCLKNIVQIRVSTSEKSNTFTDVGSFYSWAKDAINYLAEKEIINGVSPGKFAPDKPLTRAQFAKIITISLNLKTKNSNKFLFKDISTNDWYYTYVELAAENGLITGYTDNTFKPNEEVTRQEIIVMIVRAMGLEDEASEKEGKYITYKDKSKIPLWALGSVEIAQEKELLNNIAVGYFCGEKTANRAEAAVMVYRMLKFTE